ncbi:LysR family transcriptional regulator [Sinobacterium norvegicum]|uniref:LysR family transcriptional regulator n=1 Tax=Sinobacterium norvegicum TaxID=1641715 RepID=UPI001F2FA95C|nr:LysR family transcriptional regulator [Sinobacterium norvegicum]
MSLNTVDLNLFVVFDAIYQQRNLTRASEVLCMSQPAVSNALSRLRRSLDDQLFVRCVGGVKPTPMAESIVARVQEALQLLNASINETAVFDPAKSDKVFRLSMNQLAEATLLPPLLTVLAEQAPHIGLEAYYVGRNEIERELAAGTIDLALDVPMVAGPQICIEPLNRHRFVCVARQQHSTLGSEISLDEYLSLDHIQVSSRRQGPSFEDVALNRLGLKRQVKVRMPHYQVAASLVEQTDMLLTIPYNMARRYPLKIFELPFASEALNWSLYWSKSADQDQANAWIRKLLSTIVKQSV